jgi:hypothetical protein
VRILEESLLERLGQALQPRQRGLLRQAFNEETIVRWFALG